MPILNFYDNFISWLDNSDLVSAMTILSAFRLTNSVEFCCDITIFGTVQNGYYSQNLCTKRHHEWSCLPQPAGLSMIL